MSNTNKPWQKSPAAIVDEISDENELQWDTDSNITILTEFIENHCNQNEFEKFVRDSAKDELEIISEQAEVDEYKTAKRCAD